MRFSLDLRQYAMKRIHTLVKFCQTIQPEIIKVLRDQSIVFLVMLLQNIDLKVFSHMTVETAEKTIHRRQ